jgi:tetratricopeptide (TPR) repeat protein
LPTPPDDFTGREEELRELRQAIQEGGVHISGLQGQGGIGKTSLALKLAVELTPRFPDGQMYLDLKGVSERPLTAAEALSHVIRSFHPDTKLPEKEEELRALYNNVLHEKHVLLLMDNARDAVQVQPLIPPAGCTLLVTSRTTFTLPGLKPKRLDTLPPNDAKTLLLRIAPRIDNAADAIAKSCGYLALALRLAATALAEHLDQDPGEYARKLADESKRLQLLPQAGLDPSMEASITLSYNLLDGEMQARWSKLGIFPDTFDALAAAAVWEIENEAAQNTLSRLLQFSMLEWDESARRYRLHDMMRAFARGKISSAEEHAASLRHAEHYLVALWRADDLYTRGGESVLQGLALYDLELKNIQVGHVWAASHAERDRQAMQLCSSYPARGVNVLQLRQHPREGIRWCELALEAARRLKDRGSESAHLGNLGIAYDRLSDYRRAIEYHEQHLAIAREIGHRLGEGQALGNLGIAYRSLGEYRRAIDYHDKHLAIAREIGNRLGEGNAQWNISLALDRLGKRKQAIEHAEAALKIYEQIETPGAAKVKALLEAWRRES